MPFVAVYRSRRDFCDGDFDNVEPAGTLYLQKQGLHCSARLAPASTSLLYGFIHQSLVGKT